MNELVEWLRAQLDEDEQVAREAFTAIGGEWKISGGYVEVVGDTKGHEVFDWTVTFDEGSPSEGQREHIARHDPARVQAEVEAKRRLLDLADALAADASDAIDGPDPSEALTLAATARAIRTILALPYAGRAGYRDEWRPTS